MSAIGGKADIGGFAVSRDFQHAIISKNENCSAEITIEFAKGYCSEQAKRFFAIPPDYFRQLPSNVWQ